MEKQQTAVEFLYEFVLLKLTNEQQMQFDGLFHQAKQMEKEQIMDAVNYGPDYNKAEDYYNETFKSEEDEKRHL